MSEETIIYPAQPLPPEEPGGGRKRPLALGIGALVIILVLGATALAVNLFSRDDEPDPAPVAEPTPTTLPTEESDSQISAPAPSTTVAPRRPQPYFRAEGGGDQAASSYGGRPPAVGDPTPALPTRDFTWDKVQLSASGGGYISSIQWIGDSYLALGSRYDEFQSSLVAWESSDGLNWQEAELSGDFENANVWQIHFNEFGAIAIGDSFPAEPIEGDEAGQFVEPDPYHYEHSQAIWTSRDGINWTKWAVGSEIGNDRSFWVSASGVGAPGFVVVMNSEDFYGGAPMELTFGDRMVIIDEYAGVFTVTDLDGNELASGGMDELYGWGEQLDGQAVWDPDTGDLIVVVPWDVWEMAYANAYEDRGPLGGFAYEPFDVTIEHEGWRITLDEENFVYTVENIDSGEVVVSGDMDSLWRGPNPEIYDDAGNLVLSLTWDELDRAQEAYWQSYEYEYEYSQDTFAFVSSDGVNWSEAQIAEDSMEFMLESIHPSGDGFIAFGSSYDESGGGPEIWTSADGLTWTKEADVQEGMHIWNVQRTAGGGFIATGESEYGNAVWSSPDGIAWSEALGTRIPEDRDYSEWFNTLATGELGTFVTGWRERYYGYPDGEEPEPATITKNGRTLTYDDWEWPPTVTVTDDASGEVLFEFQFDEQSGVPEGVTYDSEARITTISDADGNAIFEFTDDEFYQAQESRWGYPDEYDYEMPQTTMYFSTDLEEWFEIVLDPDQFDGYLGQIAVGPDSVVVVFMPHVEYDYALEEGAASSDLAPAYEEPPMMVVVGRPVG